MRYTIHYCVSPEPICNVEICAREGLSPGRLLGRAVEVAVQQGIDLSVADLCGAFLWGAILPDARLNNAVLRGSNLRWASLCGADLQCADLRGADLRGADFRNARMRGAILPPAPAVERIHQRVHEAALTSGALFPDDVPSACGVADLVVAVAGDAGQQLAKTLTTTTAAALIYMASDPRLDRIPNFLVDPETALDELRRLADAEAKRTDVSRR
jgi:hypothetical protein